MLTDPPFGTAYCNPSVVAAGTNQASATPISAIVSVVSSTPSGTGVMLSDMQMRMQIIFNNDPSNALNVYPQPGMTINSLSANAAYSVAAQTCVGFLNISLTNAYTIFNFSAAGGSISGASLPTSLPATSGVLWNNNGMVSVS